MIGFLERADDVLRGHPWTTRSDRPGRALGWLAGYVVLCGALYGGVMGCFGGVWGDRAWQVVYSAAKVPLLLLVTLLLSLPSFFVLNTLLGVRANFAQGVRSLVATQAALTLVLVSLAPFTLLWYASSADYTAAMLFNAAMFTTASACGQWVLRRAYRPLIARRERHRWLLRIWFFLYAFVGIQMAWVLRPFIGDPNSPTLQSILNQLRQASDIMSDGSQDPAKQCDAISIGLGFTMKSAQLGPVAPPTPPPADPCIP